MFSRLLLISASTVLTLAAPNLLAQEQGREILPEQINSSFIEIRPFISGDGQTLYFSRREHPENFNGEKDMQDIWVVSRSDHGWDNPQNLGRDINNKFANSLCSVSPDGQELLMFNTYKKIEGPLARFRKSGDGWGKPEEVIIENYQNYNQYLDFFQSFREKVLLLAIETDDSKGEQDLYVSFGGENGHWSQPLNLGAGINTAKSEFAPFLAADGKTLFFSSYGRKGQGGADIYYSRRLDDSWQKWSEPVNLGEPINSRGEETYCSVTDDMQNIYYVSYHHGSDMRDIIKSELPVSLRKTPEPKTVAASDVPVAEVQANQVTASSEAAVALPVQENAEAADLTEAQTVSTTTAPEAAEPTAPEAQQTYTAHTPAKAAVQNKSAAGSLGLSVGHKSVTSAKPDVDEYLVLRNIYFDFNQLGLKKEAYGDLLQEIARYLKQHTAAKIKLVGHSDELGTAAGNLKTSEQRAKSVKDFLVKQGIPQEQILVEFMGEKAPLATNDDDREGRELNRRVEMYLLIPRS